MQIINQEDDLMSADPKKVGEQILSLRKTKGLTQQELGERLNISFQAISKWERGETLPDTALLPDLADVLETTVDNLLVSGDRTTKFQRRVTITQVREAIECFVRFGELLGKDNYFYLGAIQGVDQKMSIELEKYLSEPFTKEAMIAEAAMQCIRNGAYIDMTDIKKSFSFPHWADTVTAFAQKCGIR